MRPLPGRLFGAVLFSCTLLGTAGAEGPPAPDLRTARLVDLSHAFDEKTLYWPTETAGFQHSKLAYGKTPAGYFYASYSLCTPEHGGTHIDAPIHFGEGRRTLAEIPIEQLIAPAVVIDVSPKAAAAADYRLTTGDIAQWEKEHGKVPARAVVLLRTGWSRRWPDRKAYFGDDTPKDASKLHFPSFGAEGARILVEERGVAGLGVDTASIDHGPSKDFTVHQIAAAKDVYGLENLTNLDQLPPTGAWVVALPMKIGAGSGGPVRVVAVVSR